MVVSKYCLSVINIYNLVWLVFLSPSFPSAFPVILIPKDPSLLTTPPPDLFPVNLDKSTQS